MSVSISSLVANSEIAALTFKQKLEPLEGFEIPIFPPTYPSPTKQGQHRFDTPYTVNETKDGVRTCDLDSVQSQANRMEAEFTKSLADFVPQHVVQAGDHQVALTELPHRIADASIRATDLRECIHNGMLAIDSGDPMPLAKLAPTSLIYGVWDSRDTQIKLPRAIRSEIRAYDISIFTRSAQYSGAFNQEVLEIDDKDWNKASEVGFAPTPSVNAHGGILVHGEILHSASILLNVLRRYQTSDGSDLMQKYLLGLTLAGLLFGGKDYELRSGCFLVPSGRAEWQTVAKDGKRQSIVIEDNAVMKEVRKFASEWADMAGIKLGGKPKIHKYDAKIAKSMLG